MGVMSNGIAAVEIPSGLSPASIWSTFFWMAGIMSASEASSATVERSMRLRPSSSKSIPMPLSLSAIHLPPTTNQRSEASFSSASCADVDDSATLESSVIGRTYSASPSASGETNSRFAWRSAFARAASSQTRNSPISPA